MILNAFHDGQALATALKLNDTVVDLNLADNWQCADEGAEACEPIWDELTAGGLDLPDIYWLWLTLTVSHFSNTEWMDVLSACFCYSQVKLGWQWPPWFLQAMAVVLSTNAAIKRLNLESCRIRDAGVEAAKGCRGEGSRDLTWVRLVVGCSPLTLLGKLCHVRDVTGHCFWVSTIAQGRV